MEIIRFISALYIFAALLLIALCVAVQLSFPSVAHYAYSIALVIHTLFVAIVFIEKLKASEKKA